MTIEPGRLLAGRYRVEDLVYDRAGARLWRAVDEVLRRSVAVDILPASSPRAPALVNAARHSTVVADARFLRVLDASQENGDVYVVREWARGEDLDQILADGALTHRRAAWVVRELGEAVSAAHRAGIYHWRLVPENIIITDTGAVRIVGLATEAAIEGLRYAKAEAEAEDVRALGRVLYATLVARWPGGGNGCALRRAPSEHGRLLSPRQVRAGVPRALDDICDRILGDPPRHHAQPLRTADEVVAALEDAAGLTAEHTVVDPDATQLDGPAFGDTAEQDAVGREGADIGRIGIGVPAGPPPAVPVASAGGGTDAWTSNRHTDGFGLRSRETGGPASGFPGVEPAAAGFAPRQSGDATGLGQAGPATLPKAADRDRRRGTGLIIALLVLVCAVAAFLVGFTLNNTGGGGDGEDAGGEPADAQPIAVRGVQAWDPYGEDGENDEDAALAIDGDPETAWTTMSYFRNAEFGGLKPGLGLVLDLGSPQDVSTVEVDLGGGGTDFEVRVAPGSDDAPPDQLDDYQVQGEASSASGPTVVDLDRAVTTRYVLVWLTSLPADGSEFKGSVNEVSVSG
jgi:putative peptidoglycan lipid II flippase